MDSSAAWILIVEYSLDVLTASGRERLRIYAPNSCYAQDPQFMHNVVNRALKHAAPFRGSLNLASSFS